MLCMYAEIVSDASRQERFSVGHQDSWNMVPGMYAETVCRETSPIPVRDATCLSSMISTGVFCGFCGFYVFCCFGGFSVFLCFFVFFVVFVGFVVFVVSVGSLSSLGSLASKVRRFQLKFKSKYYLLRKNTQS